MRKQFIYNNIRCGDFHVHTSYTDGQSNVAEYCERARQNGLKVIAFTEHVRKIITYNYQELLSDIRKARNKFGDIKILSGCEAKVLNIYGELDAPGEVLEQCDVVVGVFHGFECSNRKEYLSALVAMLQNRFVSIWGHPTLFLSRKSIELEEREIKNIVDVCIKEGVFIERNIKYGLPDARFIELAVKSGAKFIVSSDAHDVDELLTTDRLVEEWNWIDRMC
ncbi:MAG: PHP domain-containing protein [Dehalococcoidales bacterium]|nr:PHP domain-containing protein [Dehalococcoidales bacterium]